MLQCHCLNRCLTHLAGTSPRPHSEGLSIPLPEPIRLTSVAYGYNVNHLLVIQHLVDHAVLRHSASLAASALPEPTPEIHGVHQLAGEQ